MATDVDTLVTASLSEPPVNTHLDIVTASKLIGWAFKGHQPLTVEAVLDGEILASTCADVPRPDVGLDYPGQGNSAACGFELALPALISNDSLLADITIRARDETGRTVEFARHVVPTRGALDKAIAAAERERPVGPFPRQIVNIVETLWPEAVTELSTAAGQKLFAEKMVQLAAMPRLQSLAVVVRYVRYLKACWSHFEFVNAYFPTNDPERDQDAKDAHFRANTPGELMSIAHQLYVLKSYGIDGDFAEFGCFKGFSSSMLSQACTMLDVQMHIFDSFEGLPPSASSYYKAGDFAGGKQEVRSNIALFGTLDSVTLHKGFFSQSLKKMKPPQLMCLWMDVDLEISAQDLLVAIEGLSPQGNLFSHECAPDIFTDGEIAAIPSPDNPIPPVKQKFESLGRTMTGTFVSGNTGAFWAKEGGTPVVANRILLDMIAGL